MALLWYGSFLYQGKVIGCKESALEVLSLPRDAKLSIGHILRQFPFMVFLILSVLSEVFVIHVLVRFIIDKIVHCWFGDMKWVTLIVTRRGAEYVYHVYRSDYPFLNVDY